MVFARRMGEQSWRLGRWLLVAFLLEALITMYVPQEAITSILGKGSRFAIPLAALIGLPLYLGNLSALPIVKGLLLQGIQPSAGDRFPDRRSRHDHPGHDCGVVHRPQAHSCPLYRYQPVRRDVARISRQRDIVISLVESTCPSPLIPDKPVAKIPISPSNAGPSRAPDQRATLLRLIKLVDNPGPSNYEDKLLWADRPEQTCRGTP